MRRGLLLALFFGQALLFACGGTQVPVRSGQVRAALANSAELLEFETPTTRLELFRELSRASQTEAGQLVSRPVMFPISQGGDPVAAPGLDARADLLQVADAGQAVLLAFSTRSEDRWPEDRRESLQGLSEREVAELVARGLLAHWGIYALGPVQVDRAAGAPYAAAYVDGILRLNPSFLYLAASVGAPAALAAAAQ